MIPMGNIPPSVVAIGKVFTAIGKIFKFVTSPAVQLSLFVAQGVMAHRAAMKAKRTGADILLQKYGTGAGMPVIYGTRRVGSTVVYMNTINNKELFVVYAIAGHEIDSFDLESIHLDGRTIKDLKIYRQGYDISDGSTRINFRPSGETRASGAFWGNTSTERANITGGANTGDNARMTFNCHVGTDSQAADPMLEGIISEWTSNHKLSGIAYIAANYEYDIQGMFTGIPNLTVVVNGKKVFDPRDTGQTFGTESTYTHSSNAALCLLDYITNDEYGKGLGSADLESDFASWKTAANDCDNAADTITHNSVVVERASTTTDRLTIANANEDDYNNFKVGNKFTISDGVTTYVSNKKLIDKDSSLIDIDGTNPVATLQLTFESGAVDTAITSNTTCTFTETQIRFDCNGVLDTDETVLENTKLLIANMRGIFTYSNGEYQIKVEGTESSVVSLDEDDILDSGITLALENKEAKYNKVESEFYNAQKRYESDTTYYTGETSDSFLSDDGNEVLETRIQLPFCTNQRIAYNHAKAMLKRSRSQKSISFVATPKVLKAKVGEVISITSSNLNLSSEQYRITNMVINPDLNISVNAVEYQTAVYGYVTPPDEEIGIIQDPVDGQRVEAPTGLTFTNKNSTTGEAAKLTWTDSSKYPSYEFRVQIVDTGNKTRYDRRVQDTTFYLDGISVANGYTAKVSAINALGVESDTTEIPVNVTTAPVTTPDIEQGSVGGFNFTATKMYYGTAGNFNNTDTAVYFDNAGQFSLKDKLSWNGTTLNISGNLTVENTISADKILLDGNNLADLFESGDSGSDATLTTNSKIQRFNWVDGLNTTHYGLYIDNTGTYGEIGVGTVSQPSDAIHVRNSGARLRLETPSTGYVRVKGSGTSMELEAGNTGAGYDNTSYILMDIAGNDVAKFHALGGMELPSLTPTTTTNRLYNNAGTLYWNGSQVGVGAINSVTNMADNRVLTASGSNSVNGEANLTFDGSMLDVRGSTRVGRSTSEYIEQITSDGTNTIKAVQDSDSNAAHNFVIDRDFTASTGASNFHIRNNGSNQLSIDKNANVTIAGNLTVNGTTTTIDTTNTNVKDNNITLNYSTDDSSATANGAGITIQDAVNSTTNATILWNTSDNRFDFSHKLNISGGVTISSGHLTVNTSTLKTTNDAIGLFTTDLTVGNNVAQQSTATPKRIFFNNDFSSGFTDASLKLYLFNDSSTRQGFTSGPAYDLQYHSSGSSSGRHAFYVANVEEARIDAGGIDIRNGGLDINGTTVINSSKELRNIEAIRIQSTEIMDNTRLLKNITGIQLVDGNRQIKFLGTSGPFGFEFGDTEANPNFRIYYRTTPNTLTFENNAESAKHTFDLDGDYTAVRDISAGRNLSASGTLGVTGKVTLQSNLELQGGVNDSIDFVGTGSDTVGRKFAYEASDHHYVTNRHTNGDLVLMSNNGTGGGETARMTLQAGSGTQDIDITNANLDLNSNNIANVGAFTGNATFNNSLTVEGTTTFNDDVTFSNDILGNTTFTGVVTGTGFVSSSTTGTAYTSNNSVYFRVIAPAVESGHTTKHELSMGWSSAYDRTYQAPKIDGTFDFNDEFGYNFAEGNWYFEDKLRVGNLNIGSINVIDSSRQLVNITNMTASGTATAQSLVSSNGNITLQHSGNTYDYNILGRDNTFRIVWGGGTKAYLKTGSSFHFGDYNGGSGGTTADHQDPRILTTGATTIGSYSVKGLHFATNNANRFTIGADGDVNIVSGALEVGGQSVITSARNLENIGTISSTGLVTIDANGNGNTLHIHDDSTGGQPGLIITDTGSQPTSTQTFYAKQYGSAVSVNLFGQSIGGKAFVGTEGSASGGLLIGTVTADNIWIGTNNALALTIDSSQNATFAGTISSGAITSSSTATASGGFITTSDLALRDYTTDARIHLGNLSGGASGVFAGRRLTTSGGLLYGTYWAYDAFWDDTNQNWTANRTTLGRKWKTEMGYHIDAFKVSRFDGTVSSSWDEADWDNLLTIQSATSTFATDLALTSGHAFKIGGTTVIDSSRNLTNIGTISSGAITSSGNFSAGSITGSGKLEINQAGNGTSNQPSAVAELSGQNQGGVLKALSLVNSVTAALGNGTQLAFHNANGYSPTGTLTVTQAGDTTTDSKMEFQIYRGGLQTVLRIDHDGHVDLLDGNLKINGTTVIDTSRNLHNIGTISSETNSNRFLKYRSGSVADFEISSDNNTAPVMTVTGTGTADIFKVRDNTTDVFTVADGGNATFAGNVDLTSTHQLSISGQGGFRGVNISGTAPGLYLDDTDVNTAWHLGANGDYLYVLEDTDSSGAYNEIRARWGANQYEQYSGHINIRSGALKMGSGATTVIDSSRNLTNIGTISSGAITASGVDNLLYLQSGATGTPTLRFEQGTTRRAFLRYQNANSNFDIINEYGGVAIWTGTSGSESQKVLVDSSGNVGIGTAPAFTLGGGLEIERGGTTTLRLQNTAAAKTVEFNMGTDLEIKCLNTGSDIILTPTANVGIGTSSLSEKLQVEGNIRVSGRYKVGYYDAVSSSSGKLFFGDHGDDLDVDIQGFAGGSRIYLTDGEIYMFGSSGGNSQFYFADNGHFHANNNITAYSTSVSSDLKLKDNISTIDNSLATIMALRGVDFTWKRDNKQAKGFIAQEVEEILPELVAEAPTLGTDDTHKTVDYQGVIPVLVEAIKEQQKQIDELKAKLK